MCTLILVLDNDLKKIGHTTKRYNLHATVPTVKPAHPKNHCWSGIGKMLNLPKEMNAVSTKGQALNTSSVRRWFLLSSCTSFAALHSSARNHATQFSMFFCSSPKKNSKNILPSVIANLLGLMFFAAQKQVSNRRPLLQEV